MSADFTPEWAAAEFDKKVVRVRELHDQCIVCWRLVDAKGLTLSKFPALSKMLDEVRALEDELGRESAFEFHFESASPQDAERHSRNLQVLAKFDAWWLKFESDVKSVIETVKGQLGDASAKVAGGQ